MGYLLYATHNGGWTRVIKEADILLILAPCYYVSISLWIAKQRLPLGQIPVVRAIQGLALIGTAYLGIAWFLSKIHFLVLTFVPFQFLIFLLLGLAGMAYLGYLRLTGSDLKTRQKNNFRATPFHSNRNSQREASIDKELEALRREINRKK